MKVIGLGHRARQGKDTLARYMIIEAGRCGLYAKQFAFADPLRALARVLGMRQKDGILLQALGTNVMRRIDKDTWVRIMIDNLKEVKDNLDLAVITDVRFPNEAEALQVAYDTQLVKVTRISAQTGDVYIPEDRDPNHESEIAMENYIFHHHTIASEARQLEWHAHEILNKVLSSP